jgi:ribosomal protein S18 acetylase RimI-like enzyme
MPDPDPAPLLLRSATTDEIRRLWSDRLGLPVVTPQAAYLPTDVSGLAIVCPAGEILGLVTWALSGSTAEIVTLDSLCEGKGLGSRLLAAAEQAAAAQGAVETVIVTTNDNLRAFGLYVRRGYRLVAVHLDGMDAVRAVKPGVPLAGEHGIPLRDLWELHKDLVRAPP